MFNSDNPDAPVRTIAYGAPDQLDEWLDEQHEDEDPTYDPDGPHEELYVEECEHGLSLWLCAGPGHYPMDM